MDVVERILQSLPYQKNKIDNIQYVNNIIIMIRIINNIQ